MKQLPERIEIIKRKRIWPTVALIMFLTVFIIAARFWNYNPNIKNSIVVQVSSFIVYVFSFLLSVILPLILEMADMKALQNGIVHWYNRPEKRNCLKKIIKVTKVILIVASAVLLVYMFPRSFAPKMYRIYFEMHETTVADTTDIKVIVETNLTVDKILLDDNEVKEDEVAVCEEKGFKRIYSKVLNFDTEDTVHTITAKIISNNSNVEVQELSVSYTPNTDASDKNAESEKNSWTPAPTTPPSAPEKTEGELTTVCIPAHKMKTVEGMVEFNSYIGSANVDKLIELYSKMVLPNLDAFIVVTSNKRLTGVTLYAVSETTSYAPFSMSKIDENTWYFDADFTENSNFEISVTASADDGAVFYDKIELSFPFE